MNEQIEIAAYHEAGHAIMAYVVGWGIKSIDLLFKKDKFVCGRTTYDFNGVEEIKSEHDFNMRIWCLVGGPVSQLIFKGIKVIDIRNLGTDGTTIDEMCNKLDPIEKQETIQRAISVTLVLFGKNEYKLAAISIANKLIESNHIPTNEFLQIMAAHNIKPLCS